MRLLRNELTGVIQGVSKKRRLLTSFQYGCKKAVILEKRPVEEEPKVPMIPVIPDETFTSEKGYYHGVCVVIYFHK